MVGAGPTSALGGARGAPRERRERSSASGRLGDEGGGPGRRGVPSEAGANSGRQATASRPAVRWARYCRQGRHDLAHRRPRRLAPRGAADVRREIPGMRRFLVARLAFAPDAIDADPASPRRISSPAPVLRERQSEAPVQTPAARAPDVPKNRSPASPRPGRMKASLVELAVERRGPDRHVGMGLLRRRATPSGAPRGRRGAAAGRRPRCSRLERGTRAAAGREHRVEDEHGGVGEARAAGARSSRPGAGLSSSRYMPRWPTRASGSRRRKPSTMPRPARRTGTIATSPSRRRPSAGSSGVATVTRAVGRSRMASIGEDRRGLAERAAEGLRARSRGRAASARRSASSGWSTTCSRLGHARDPRRSPATAACRLQRQMAAAAPQRRAQGPRPRSRRARSARPRARRRRTRACCASATRTSPPRTAGSSCASRSRAARELIAYERPDAAGGAREPLPPRRRSPTPTRCARRSTRRSGRSSSSTSAAGCCCGEGVRIHLDEVEGLGAFVELEGGRGRGVGPRAARRTRVAAPARGARDRRRRDSSRRGYADLLREGATARAARRSDGAEELPARRRGGDGARPRAVLALPRRRRAAHDRRRRRTPARTSRTPPTRRASARRPRRSARMVAAGGTADRRGRRRWPTPSSCTAVRRLPPAAGGVRPAATTPVHLGRPGGLAPHDRRSASCCRWASAPRDLPA